MYFTISLELETGSLAVAFLQIGLTTDEPITESTLGLVQLHLTVAFEICV